MFHNIELNFGECNVRYQFGMHNPDYPALIRKKLFVLDFDAFYQGLQSYAEISGYMDTYHRRIQELFELSITESLREVLNGKK